MVDWRRRTVRRQLDFEFNSEVSLADQALDYDAVVVASGTLGARKIALPGLQEALRSGKAGLSEALYKKHLRST